MSFFSLPWFRPPNTPIRDWSSRTVWVVGASTGIGLALGQALVRHGAQVCVSSRRLDALEAGFPESDVLKVICDIREPGAVRHALAQQSARSRLPDVVFWVAGDYKPLHSAQFDPVVARDLIETNLNAAFDGLSALGEAWGLGNARSGSPSGPPRHLCWFGSVAAYRGLPQALAYSASKAGLMAMAETSHVELKPLGVDVSIVSPGFVQTRLTDQNTFEMPALLTTDQAAQETLAGLATGAFEIHFPKRFTLGLKLLRILPHRIALALLSRTRPQ
jgi:NAD(P)-dependent dehydrogenase (short-subunit alcohol dehydrogenase family)